MRNSLRALRAARDWSQADLAQALGVSRQTVNALETGKYDPSLPLAFKIARLFEKRIEDVFQPNGSAKEPGQVNEMDESASWLFSSAAVREGFAALVERLRQRPGWPEEYTEEVPEEALVDATTTLLRWLWTEIGPRLRDIAREEAARRAPSL